MPYKCAALNCALQLTVEQKNCNPDDSNEEIMFQISIHGQCIPLEESDRLGQWLQKIH